jgi:hypothetical protein
VTAARGGLEDRVHVLPRSSHRRHQADDDAGQQRGGGTDREDAGVHLDRAGGRVGEVGRGGCDDRVHSPRRQQDPEAAAARGDQHAFDQDRSEQPSAGGADRDSNRRLVLARADLRQNQAGSVRAGDQEDEPHRAEEDEERRACAVGYERDRLARDRDVPEWFSRQRHFLLETRRYAIGHLLCRPWRQPRRQPPDPDEPLRRVVRDGLDVHRDPQVLVVAGKPEPARHDADHGVRSIVERDRGAQYLPLSTESPAPEGLADQHHPRRSRAALSIREVAPDEGTDAEHPQQAGRDRQASHAFGLSVSGDQIHLLRREAFECLEQCRLALPSRDLLRREIAAARTGRPIQIQHFDEPLGVGEWRGPEDGLIDDGEDRSGAPRSQAEHQDDQGRVRRLRPEAAKRQAQVAHHGTSSGQLCHGPSTKGATDPPAPLGETSFWSLAAGTSCPNARSAVPRADTPSAGLPSVTCSVEPAALRATATSSSIRRNA